MVSTFVSAPSAHPPLVSTRNKQNRAVASSLIKALDLLTVLARRRAGLSVSLLVRKLALPRTSVLRMLTTLEQYGLVAKQGRDWRVTEQFFRWSSWDTLEETVHRYHPLLQTVAQELGELVQLSIGEAGGIRFIDWVQPRPEAVQPLSLTLYPLQGTAAGKLVLAYRPELAAAELDTRRRDEVLLARSTGVARNRSESNRHVIAIATWAAPPSPAAPIISVVWPVTRFTEAQARRALALIRRELTQESRAAGGGSICRVEPVVPTGCRAETGGDHRFHPAS